MITAETPVTPTSDFRLPTPNIWRRLAIEAVERALWQAQFGAAGEADELTSQTIRDDARAVVMRQSQANRDAADLHARAELQHWLAAESITVLDGISGQYDKLDAAAVLRQFIRQITSGSGPSIVSEVLWSYQESLLKAASTTHTSGVA